MPPTTTTLLTLSLLSLLALATPHRNSPPQTTNPTIPLPPSALPPPAPGLHLKHIALGLGTQNYTCPPSSANSSTPTSAGALATLYNLTPLLASSPPFTPYLPPLALALWGAANSGDDWWQQLAQQIPGSEGLLGEGACGRHFFAAAPGEESATPTWEMRIPGAEEGGIVWRGKKEGSVEAPEGMAWTGLGGEGAVPWLWLTEVEGGGAEGDGGIRGVYRVVTAGGVGPETCAGREGGHVEVGYAAEYWFYGV